MSSRQMEERDERLQAEWVASELGLDLNDLDLLQWEVETIDGNDGEVYGYRVVFAEGSDPELLAKVEGLQGNWVGIGFPSEEDSSEPE